MKVVRAYKLIAMGNKSKIDTSVYLINRYSMYTQYCVGILFFNGNKTFSTKGCGLLFNQAQHKARTIISALKAMHIKTGHKINVPLLKNIGVPCKLEKAKKTSFDYFVSVPNQWSKTKIRLPVKSTKPLNKALKNGWQFTPSCEIKNIKGKIYVIAFVEKEVDRAIPSADCIGVDVGINKSIVSSDGHYGQPLKDKIDKFKESQKERYRQRSKFGQIQKLRKNRKTYIKQILDIEAKEAVRRSCQSGCSIVVESRKAINYLRSGRISLWARNYFANRCEVLCKEQSVFFLEVNPWMSSQTCSNCRERGERLKEEFVCKNSSCSEYLKKVDADFNASKELMNRGRQVIIEKILPKYNVNVAENITLRNLSSLI